MTLEDSQVPREVEEAEAAAVSPIEIIVFLVRSAGRHIRFGAVLASSIALVGVIVALIFPARYEAQCKVLFLQSATVAAALSSPNQRAPTAVAPVQETIELLRQKTNLVNVVSDADLLTHFRSHRPPLLRIKDFLLDKLRGPRSDEKMKVMLAETLESRLTVGTQDGKDSLVTIAVAWTDPDMVVKLAAILQRRFLEMRKEQELSGINVAIAINEDELKNAAGGIDVALGEVMRSRERARLPSTVPAPAASAENSKQGFATRRYSPPKAEVSLVASAPDSKKLMAQIAETRQKAQQLEEAWQRRVVDLKFQLNDMRSTYGPEHPLMVQQQARINEVSHPPAELTELREHERKLIAELEIASSAQEAEKAKIASSNATAFLRSSNDYPPVDRSRPLQAGGTLIIAERDEDPRIAPAKANLTAAIKRYTDVTQRLDAARIDLTSAQVALKYRYAVVAEPERPRAPKKPNRPMIAIGSILAAALVGFLSGAIRDLLSGRVFEPWQARIPGLNVLGDVELSKINR